MVTTDSKTAIFIKWLVDSFEKCPQKIAVIDDAGKRKTTYEELYVMACRVVGYTRKQQLPSHSFIGICLPTSMEYIAAEIGIWLAGHAIVPMGDQFPESRIKQIMEHSDSPLLIDEKVMSEIASTEPVEPSTLPEEDDINTMQYDGGIRSFVEFINRERRYDVLHNEVIYFKKEGTFPAQRINENTGEAERTELAYEAEVAMQYNDSYVDLIVSFANDIRTADGDVLPPGFGDQQGEPVDAYMIAVLDGENQEARPSWPRTLRVTGMKLHVL